MPAGNLFQHFKPRRVNPERLVSVRSANTFLAKLAALGIEVIGAENAEGSTGADYKLDSAAASSDQWTVTGDATSGFTISGGEVSLAELGGGGRVPTIEGVPINGPAGDGVDQPILPGKADGTICVEVSLRMTYNTTIPANGSGGINYPRYGSALTWNAWPTIKWMDEVTIAAVASFPPSGSYNDTVFPVPVAHVIDGSVYRLRWMNIILYWEFVTTVGQTRV